MGQSVSIINLEKGINSCRAAQPPDGIILTGDLRLLADVYGTLIYANSLDRSVLTMDVALLDGTVQEVLARWVDLT